MTVRERIELLLDEGSFREIGAASGFGEYDEAGELVALQPTNSVFGRGDVEGRPVVVSGDDFTVRGGTADASIHEKQVAAEQFANEYRLPLLRLIEGTGGGGSVKSLETMGFAYVPMLPGWEHTVDNLATVPVVALGLGPVAGLGAVDDAVDSEEEAIARTRAFLSYLPSSVFELPPRKAPHDDPDLSDGHLRLKRGSAVRVRCHTDDLPRFLPLSGKELELAGCPLRLGRCCRRRRLTDLRCRKANKNYRGNVPAVTASTYRH